MTWLLEYRLWRMYQNMHMTTSFLILFPYVVEVYTLKWEHRLEVEININTFTNCSEIYTLS